jgi:hypothetical protein
LNDQREYLIVRYGPTGLVWRFDWQRKDVIMGVLAGKMGLILEDEWLIAADIAVMLERADAASAPSFHRCTEAETFLRDKHRISRFSISR